MTKIAIISQPEQGVLIDVGGCATLQEATQHLTYTLQVSSQFWEDQPVDLSLGKLGLSRDELGQVFATLHEVGVRPRHIFAEAASTKAALRAYNITPAAGIPASLLLAGDEQPAAPLDPPAAPAEPIDQIVEDTLKQPAATRDTVPVEVEGTICGALPAPPPMAATEHAGSVAANCASHAVEGTQAACAETGEIQANAEGCEGHPDAAATGLVDAEATAEATAESGEQAEDQPKVQEAAKPAAPTAPHILYLRQTLRSGQAVSHKGHLVIIGDVNPGAEVIAEGDITIWGALRGVAHAGVGGNTNAEIRALRFDPIQLRIAHAIARSPDRPRGGQRYNGPETARIVNGTIRISSSAPE